MSADTWQQALDTSLVDLPDGRTLAIVVCTPVDESNERWYMDIDWLWWAKNEAGLIVRGLFNNDRLDYGALYDDNVMGIWWVSRSEDPLSWANRTWPAHQHDEQPVPHDPETRVATGTIEEPVVVYRGLDITVVEA